MQQFQRFAATYIVILIAFIATNISAEPASTLLNDPRSVPYYIGQLYPVPKQVTYHDAVLPLRDVGIVLGKGLTPADARLTVLTERISRYGGQVRVLASATEPCETLILMGDTVVQPESAREAKLPAQTEGYFVHTDEHDGQYRVFLEGHDFHGLLWAIVAFNQMVALDSEGQPVAHGLTVADYPDYPGIRGYSAMIDDSEASRAWLAVNVMRANTVIYRQLRDINDWRSPMRDEARFAAWQEKIRAISNQLTPLKIEWYDSILPLSPSDPTGQIRSKSEEDLELVVKAAKALAEAGGHLCLLYDDFRFPIHDDDERDFDSAAKADVYFINRVYEAVSTEYPRFQNSVLPTVLLGAIERSKRSLRRTPRGVPCGDGNTARSRGYLLDRPSGEISRGHLY